MNDTATAAVSLIGQPVTALDTPALLVDLDVLEANIARVAAECRAHGVNWRPHIKGNKTIEIVRKEIAAGAIGVTCAKLGEAEVMADAGITDILIANQIVGAPKLARLVALASRANVKVAVDSLANCAAIAAEARQAGVTMKLVIENDVGMNRAGVEPDKVPALAAEIAKLQGVRLVGLMAWEAHAVALDDAAKQKTVQEAIARLTRAAEACRAAGHTIEIVSCGGSGTFPYCIRQPGVTEVQCGGAIFSDVMYRNRFHLDFPPALKLLASVTSRPTPTRIILDAGKKADEQRRRGTRTRGPAAVQTRAPVGRARHGGAGAAVRHARGRRQGAVRGRLRRHDRAPARGNRRHPQGSRRGDLEGLGARPDPITFAEHIRRGLWPRDTAQVGCGSSAESEIYPAT